MVLETYRDILEASGLEEVDDVVWSAPGRDVSYPESNYDWCHAVEEESFWFRHRGRCLASWLRSYPPGGPILDVGGGNGAVTQTLQRAGFEAVLLEPGAAAVQNARARDISPILNATLEEAKLPDDSFAGVGVFDVVEHIEAEQDFLREVNRVVAPDGRLYVTVPAFEWLWSYADPVAGHYRRYSRHTLADSLHRAGFDVLDWSYFFAMLVPPVLAMRALPHALGIEIEEDERTHGVGVPGVVNTVVDAVLDAEFALVERGARIPFGTSLFAVAEPR